MFSSKPLIEAMNLGRDRIVVSSLVSSCTSVIELAEFLDHLCKNGYLGMYNWAKDVHEEAKIKLIELLKDSSYHKGVGLQILLIVSAQESAWLDTVIEVLDRNKKQNGNYQLLQ